MILNPVVTNLNLSVLGRWWSTVIIRIVFVIGLSVLLLEYWYSDIHGLCKTGGSTWGFLGWRTISVGTHRRGTTWSQPDTLYVVFITVQRRSILCNTEGRTSETTWEREIEISETRFGTVFLRDTLPGPQFLDFEGRVLVYSLEPSHGTSRSVSKSLTFVPCQLWTTLEYSQGLGLGVVVRRRPKGPKSLTHVLLVNHIRWSKPRPTTCRRLWIRSKPVGFQPTTVLFSDLPSHPNVDTSIETLLRIIFGFHGTALIMVFGNTRIGHPLLNILLLHF